jgi:hypothetical protein
VWLVRRIFGRVPRPYTIGAHAPRVVPGLTVLNAVFETGDWALDPAVSDEQFAELRRHFSEREIVELTAQAAFENFRARFNRSLRIEDDGFAALPVERLPRAF